MKYENWELLWKVSNEKHTYTHNIVENNCDKIENWKNCFSCVIADSHVQRSREWCLLEKWKEVWKKSDLFVRLEPCENKNVKNWKFVGSWKTFDPHKLNNFF